MSAQRLRDFLQDHHIEYESIEHPMAYTSQEIAQAAHLSAKDLAKPVIVKIDDEMTMVVVPAHHLVHLAKLKSLTGAKSVELASEYEFQKWFPGCELGAMPPFGNLYDMPVMVSKDLTECKEIAFNAGNHHELFTLSYKDFEKWVKPKVIDL